MVLICLSSSVSGGTADAHGSGPCTRKGVGVQIPSRAPMPGEKWQKKAGTHLPAPATLLTYFFSADSSALSHPHSTHIASSFLLDLSRAGGLAKPRGISSSESGN